MKRLARKPEVFDVLELFTAISRQKSYSIKSDDINQFQKEIGDHLKKTLSNKNILYGKRTEAMFAHVLGALGACRYIKQEDSGTSYTKTDNFVVPDYRVFTNNGDVFLVEVKNWNAKNFSSKFKLGKEYLNKLVSYSDMNRANLKIAIYISSMNRWILLSPDSFLKNESNFYINFCLAIARNEMSLFGDCSLATLSPLCIEFVADIKDESSNLAKNKNIILKIRNIHMSCAGKTITDKKEQEIAFHLMRYGQWSTEEFPLTISEDQIASFAYKVEPEELSKDQDFQFIGDLSSMVSATFREMTVNDKEINALDVECDPKFFSLNIPVDYHSEVLPLWRFMLQPNFDLDIMGDDNKKPA